MSRHYYRVCVIVSVPTSLYSRVYTGTPPVTTNGINTVLTWDTVGTGTYTA